MLVVDHEVIHMN